MLCLMELWFDCVSFGVYFELYAKILIKNKEFGCAQSMQDLKTQRNLEEDDWDNTLAQTK